jgi:hypothetical protein
MQCMDFKHNSAGVCTAVSHLQHWGTGMWNGLLYVMHLRLEIVMHHAHLVVEATHQNLPVVP